VLLKIFAGGRHSENDVLALLAVVPGLEETVESRSDAMPASLRRAWRRLLNASKRDDPTRR
jgi:hypothetical protein